MKPLLTTLAAAFSVLCSNAGYAQPADDDAARRLLGEADVLARSNDLASSCAKVVASYKIVASDATRDRISSCYQQLGRTLRASGRDGEMCKSLESELQVEPSERSKNALASCDKARALVLMDAKDPHACEPADAAVVLVGSARNLAFDAGCYESVGQRATAWRRYLDAKAKAREDHDDATAAQISELLAQFRPGPGRVVVRVTGPATITVDGHPITANALVTGDRDPTPDDNGTIGFPLDAGNHVVRATRSMGMPFETTVKIEDGRLETVQVTWPAESSEVPPPPPQKPALALHPNDTRRRNGWVAIGTGAVFGLAGLAVGYDALTTQSSAEDACPTHKGCSVEATTKNDHAATLATVSDILVGVALASGAVGTYFVLTSGETRVVPAVSGTEIGVSLSGRF